MVFYALFHYCNIFCQISTARRKCQGYKQWAFPFSELDTASEPRNWKKTICFWYPLWKHNMKFFYIQKLRLAFYSFQLLKSEHSTQTWGSGGFYWAGHRVRASKPRDRAGGFLSCLVQDDETGSAGKHKAHIKNKQHTQRAQHKRWKGLFWNAVCLKKTTIHHWRGDVQPQPNLCLLKETCQGAAL